MERVVIIPALNPDDRLRDIVDRNWKLENQVILVDDGSDQKYREFFDELEEKCILLRHDKNLGKGAAIKTALKFIKKEIWDCRVIGVMDADGQHLADDMEKLLMKAASKPDALILGSRTIDRKVPWKSRVGNLITRKVFQMETGTRVSDTQTGLRAFSSRLLEVMLDIPGERYEYEMNVLVTCAKRNIPIVEVPIRTIYHDKDNSCSHFRKVRDSIRIYRELLKFSFVSFSSFLLDYVLFMILTVLLPGTAWGILAANIAARLLSGTYNYTLNCRIVFRRKQTVKTAADYFILAVGILVLNNILLQGFTYGLGIPVYLAKILTEICLFVTSWLVQKKLIFRKRKPVRHFAARKKVLAFTADVLAAALLLGGIYGVNYLIPQKGVSAQVMTAQASASSQVKAGDPASMEGTNGTAESAASISSQGRARFLQNVVDSNPSGLPTTRVSLDSQDWHQKFADKFTDQVVSTDTSYTSPDLSIHLTYDSYQTNKLDKSENGNHEKYGTDISYVLADIYVGDITCLQTGFAQNTYGVGYSEKLSDMSARMKSVLAVNGDSYSNSRHKDNGTIIRNGVIYRAQATDMETCVLNWDGTMQIYSPQELDIQTLIDRGAYQSWIFGPSLLDENGKAKTSFQTWSYIAESHPRTAIGYYEPGHYCLLVVDGRQQTSRGMFLDEMAGLFEQLGCKAAYNLDGGHCSFMTKDAKVANHPYKPEHTVEDGIFVMEGLL